MISGYLVGSTHPIRIVVFTGEAVGNLMTFLRDYLGALFVSPDFARDPGVRQIVRDGALKSILFGTVVSYTAVAFGARSAERQTTGRAGYVEFNNGVWESAITALSICTILTLLLWTNL